MYWSDKENNVVMCFNDNFLCRRMDQSQTVLVNVKQCLYLFLTSDFEFKRLTTHRKGYIKENTLHSNAYALM